MRLVFLTFVIAFSSTSYAQESRIDPNKEYFPVFTLKPTAIEQVLCEWPMSLKEQSESIDYQSAETPIFFLMRGTVQTSGTVVNVEFEGEAQTHIAKLANSQKLAAVEYMQRLKCPGLAFPTEISQEFAVFPNSNIALPTHRSKFSQSSFDYAQIDESLKRAQIEQSPKRGSSCKFAEQKPNYPLRARRANIEGVVFVLGIEKNGLILSANIFRTIGMTIRQAHEMFAEQVMYHFLQVQCDKTESNLASTVSTSYYFQLQ
jgi:hypothetical protein